LAYERVDIGGGGYSLDPGEFALGSILERVALPIRPGRPCLAARIEGRSSYARCGLIVHFTAPTIHAGFEGKTVALEMKNLGNYPITLRTGCEIAQLVIERVSGMPFANPSQFQGQADPTGVKTSKS
jgi:dCTP deaminase